MRLRLPLAGSAVLIAAALGLPALAMPDRRSDVAIHRDTRSELASINLAAAVAVAQAQAEGPDGLPAAWCGDETADEGRVNASAPATAAQFKVVYAYAADRPNRFAGFKDALQADVSTCTTVVPACGGGELWIPAPPVATTPPSIGGRPRRGAPLETHDGTWLNHPATYTRTWQRLTKNRWITVSDASDARYAPTTKDLGHRLRVVVAAENTDGTTASTSAPTAPIAAIGITRAATNRKHRSHR